MPHIEYYKEFEIDVSLLPIEGNQYHPQVCITRHAGAEVNTKSFTDARYFSTEEEAIRYGVQMAKDIINGRVEGFSVANL